MQPEPAWFCCLSGLWVIGNVNAQSFQIYLDKVDLNLCLSYVRLESSTIILLLGLMAQMVSISDAVLILAIRRKIV